MDETRVPRVPGQPHGKTKGSKPLDQERRVEEDDRGRLYEKDVATGARRLVGRRVEGKAVAIDAGGEPANKKERKKARSGKPFRTKDGRMMRVIRIDENDVGRTVEI
jgi:hypothetical protein